MYSFVIEKSKKKKKAELGKYSICSNPGIWFLAKNHFTEKAVWEAALSWSLSSQLFGLFLWTCYQKYSRTWTHNALLAGLQE
jgi:hypothetical protein